MSKHALIYSCTLKDTCDRRSGNGSCQLLPPVSSWWWSSSLAPVMPEEKKPPVMIIPYVAGVSERIQGACRRHNIKLVFKSGPTLCSVLTKVKDPLPWKSSLTWRMRSPAAVVRSSISETMRRLETRVKERKDVCMRSSLTGRPSQSTLGYRITSINWNEARVLDRAARTIVNWFWRKRYVSRRLLKLTGSTGMKATRCQAAGLLP